MGLYFVCGEIRGRFGLDLGPVYLIRVLGRTRSEPLCRRRRRGVSVYRRWNRSTVDQEGCCFLWWFRYFLRLRFSSFFNTKLNPYVYITKYLQYFFSKGMNRKSELASDAGFVTIGVVTIGGVQH